MKNLTLLLLLITFCIQFTSAQLSLEVYNIFQNKCMNCHNNATQQAGLDLEGSGVSVTAKMNSVYNNIVDQIPNSNANAIAKGYQYIYRGRPDLSYIFRKINGNLEPTIALDSNIEGAQMPFNQTELTDVEKELIRQWILLGAPLQNSDAEIPTTYVDQIPTLVNNYYNVSGVQSFPNGGPAAPDPSEGFQIKMGPFYLNPAGQNFSEMELFQKHELELPDDVEVHRIDMKISTSSHHFVIYNFPLAAAANNVSPGFRNYPDHSFISVTAAIQDETDLILPNGTAIFWDNDMVLDLNSHYINADASNTYQAEVYFNVYIQPSGTAAQEIKTDFFFNDNILIPNDGNLTTFEQSEIDEGEVFVWGFMGHTHQWGKDYKVYLRNSDGTKGDLIYDASCSLDGVPGCVAPFFDYQHIPIRYFEPLLPLDLNSGFIHSASYENNGPTDVNWGPTSEDEMMALVMMYTTDTVGLNMPTNIKNLENLQQQVKIYPNPMTNEATVVLPENMQNVQFSLFNTIGQEVIKKQNIYGKSFTIRRRNLPKGIYLFKIEDENGKFGTGKISIE